jgi:hypothetical protein
MDLNVGEIAAATVAAWSILRSELAIRRWRNKRRAADERRHPGILPPGLIGIVDGSRVPMPCVACGDNTNVFLLYEDDSKICPECTAGGQVPCSCGHIASDGRIYPDGTKLCNKCAPVIEADKKRMRSVERTYHASERAKYEKRVQVRSEYLTNHPDLVKRAAANGREAATK